MARLFKSPMDSTHELISIIVSCHSNPSTTLRVSEPLYTSQRTWANRKWFASSLSLMLNRNTHRDPRAASVPALYTQTPAQLSTLIIDFLRLFQSSFCSTGTRLPARPCEAAYLTAVRLQDSVVGLGHWPLQTNWILDLNTIYYNTQGVNMTFNGSPFFYAKSRTSKLLLSVYLAPVFLSVLKLTKMIFFFSRGLHRETQPSHRSQSASGGGDAGGGTVWGNCFVLHISKLSQTVSCCVCFGLKAALPVSKMSEMRINTCGLNLGMLFSNSALWIVYSDMLLQEHFFWTRMKQNLKADKSVCAWILYSITSHFATSPLAKIN